MDSINKNKRKDEKKKNTNSKKLKEGKCKVNKDENYMNASGMDREKMAKKYTVNLIDIVFHFNSHMFLAISLLFQYLFI